MCRLPQKENITGSLGQSEEKPGMRMNLRAARKWFASILKLRQFCYLPMLALITVGLAAQISPAASDLPSNQNVIAFLTLSIDWYRHCAIERQISTDPVDLVFLEGNRQTAAQILQLSFDFARAGAQSSAIPDVDSQKGSTASSTGSPDLVQFVQLETNTELQSRQATEEIEAIQEKIKTADGVQLPELQAALDAAQSRLVVLQAGLGTLRQLVEFMRVFT